MRRGIWIEDDALRESGNEVLTAVLFTDCGKVIEQRQKRS